MATNNPPKPFWFRMPQACGCIRHKLYIRSTETPFFIDVACHKGHRGYGEKISLWGSGMGKEVRRRDNTTYRVAAWLGGFQNVTLAKHAAEQRAFAAQGA